MDGWLFRRRSYIDDLQNAILIYTKLAPSDTLDRLKYPSNPICLQDMIILKVTNEPKTP